LSENWVVMVKSPKSCRVSVSRTAADWLLG
jgi:hypothetical protein